MSTFEGGLSAVHHEFGVSAGKHNESVTPRSVT